MTCDAVLSTLGRKALYGPNRGKIITTENVCMPEMARVCPAGVTVNDVTQGAPERRTQTIVNGPYTSRQVLTVRPTTARFTCAG